MSHSDTDPLEQPGFYLFRPAVSPRTSPTRAAAPALDAPLAPFSGAPRAAELAGPLPVLEPPTAETGETSWREAPSAEAQEPDPMEGLPEIEEESREAVAAQDDAEWLEFDETGAFVVDAGTAALAAEPIPPAVEEPWAIEDEPALEEELIAPPGWEYGYDAVPPEPAADPIAAVPVAAAPVELPEPAPPAAPPTPDARPTPPVVEDVAARLERIARSLRDRNPAELLGRTDDPLQILIAGYVLGLSEGGRGPGEPERR